ncbi:MAG: hypothetical protein RLO81_20175 [Fulvivirga sp.]|uniref:YceI family protein n=1 Tax=Fulvivirga sp. TaxID=1931237 RepID=UPI0032ECF4BA
MNKLIVFLLLSIPIKSNSQSVTKTMVIEEESTFKISGKSSVNSFDCHIIQGFCGESVSVSYNVQATTVKFSNTKFSIPVKQFDCGSKFITRDMKETLKAEDHPFMEFELISIRNFDDLNCENSKAETLVTIAGITNRYLLNYDISKLDEVSYRIKLNSTFDINDFNLDPPTALMGLIKVDETIGVSLTLHTRFE